MDLIIFLTIVVILLIIGSLILYFTVSANLPSDTESNVVYQAEPPLSFLYACSSGQCQSDLECDLIRGLCLNPNGAACSLESDCLTGSYCSGLCFNRLTDPPTYISGNPGDPCPCDYRFQRCIAQLDQSKRCLLLPGQSCQRDQQCISGSCYDQVCRPLLPDGEECQFDYQCFQGNCSAKSGIGLCQAPGVQTGTEGSSCQPGLCDQGFQCSANNTCLPVSSGLGLSCGTTKACPHPLSCYQSNSPELCSSTGCWCLYNIAESGLPKPNQCPTGFCPANASCSGGSCLFDSEQPCVSNGQCSSGQCGDSKLYRLVVDYTNPEAQFPDSGVVGVTKVQYQAIDDLPGPVRRLTGLSIGATDYIYLLVGQSVYLSTDQTPFQLLPLLAPSGTIINDIAANQVAGQPFLMVAATTQGTDVLYQDSGNTLIPFNDTGGVAGSQFDDDGDLLSIDQIDINNLDATPSDLNVLIYNGRSYFKPVGKNRYRKQNPLDDTTNIGTVRIYRGVDDGDNFLGMVYLNSPDDNDGKGYRDQTDPIDDIFVGSVALLTNALPGGGSGGFAGAYFPSPLYQNVPQYLTNDYTILNTSTAFLAMVITDPGDGDNLLYFFTNGTLTPLPGYFGADSKVLLTSNNGYITSGSCS